MTVHLRVVEDPAGECAARLATAAGRAGDLVLTGGGTPGEAYAKAASLEPDWRHATVWFTDERCVPPTDSLSNFLLVERTLLAPLGAQAPAVRRIRGELGYGDGADAYEELLRGDGPPRFELVLLGLGPDGHIASLFPDQPTLDERTRLAVAVPQAGFEPYVPRVSLTLTALTSCAEIVVLVTGSGKADAVARAFGPHARPDPAVPGSLVAPLHDRVTVLLDKDAAAKL
jgi:6-phosphogluconolactonase